MSKRKIETSAGKAEFISELIDRVKADILANVSRMPDQWDGLELRRYIAEKFKECQIGDMRPRRVRDYNNARRVENL